MLGFRQQLSGRPRSNTSGTCATTERCLRSAFTQVIGATKGNNPARILEEVRAVGRELVRAFPTELTVGNMVRFLNPQPSTLNPQPLTLNPEH